MSFDIAVWHDTGPITKEQALAKYEAYTSSNDIQDSPYAPLETFIDELTSDFPQIDDCEEEELEECPWSCEFDIGLAHCIMCMRWGAEEEMVPIICNLAKKHGLTCYDPQSGELL